MNNKSFDAEVLTIIAGNCGDLIKVNIDLSAQALQQRYIHVAEERYMTKNFKKVNHAKEFEPKNNEKKNKKKTKKKRKKGKKVKRKVVDKISDINQNERDVSDLESNQASRFFGDLFDLKLLNSAEDCEEGAYFNY